MVEFSICCSTSPWFAHGRLGVKQAALQHPSMSRTQPVRWARSSANICHRPSRTFDKLMCVFPGICSPLRPNHLPGPTGKKCLSGPSLRHVAGVDAIASTGGVLRRPLDTLQKACKRQLHSGCSLKSTLNTKELASATGSIFGAIFIGIKMQREEVYFPGSGLFISPISEVELPAIEQIGPPPPIRRGTSMALLHFHLYRHLQWGTHFYPKSWNGKYLRCSKSF